MNTDQVYEKELLNKLEELDRTRAWVESELREVRNRMQRQVNREIIESGAKGARISAILVNGWRNEQGQHPASVNHG